MLYGLTEYTVLITTLLWFTSAQMTIKQLIEVDGDQLSLFKTYLENTEVKNRLDETKTISVLDELDNKQEVFTVFAPVDEAFELLPDNAISQLTYLDRIELMKYHMVYGKRAVPRNNAFEKTHALSQPLVWYSTFGEDQTVNGALIKDFKDAANGRLYYIDKVLFPMATNANTMAVMHENPNTYREMEELIEASGMYGEVNQMTMTMLVPNNQALTTDGGLDLTNKQSLKNNPERLKKVLQGHILEDAIWPLARLEYTSFIENTGAITLDLKAKIRIVKQGQERYIMCGGVSAKLVQADIPTASGIIHIVDKLLNYVHSNSYQQIAMDGSLSDFQSSIRQETSNEIFSYLDKTDEIKKTVLAPINTAFFRLNQETLDDLRTNQDTLLKVLNLHIIPGEEVILADIPIGGETAVVHYSRQPMDNAKPDGQKMEIRFFRDENDTYVEGGHIRAKVIRLDVGVTSGVIQYIDHVLGVPYQTIQEAIFNHVNLTQFEIYLRQTQMWSWLAIPDQKYTLFAPTNEALWKIRRADPDFFKSTWALKWVLNRHFLNETAFFFDEIAVGSEVEKRANNTNIVVLQSKAGYQYRIKYTPYSITYTSTIIDGDIGCKNGALHIINDLLFIPGSEGDIIGGSAVFRPSWFMTIFTVLSVIYQSLISFKS